MHSSLQLQLKPLIDQINKSFYTFVSLFICIEQHTTNCLVFDELFFLVVDDDSGSDSPEKSSDRDRKTIRSDRDRKKGKKASKRRSRSRSSR